MKNPNVSTVITGASKIQQVLLSRQARAALTLVLQVTENMKALGVAEKLTAAHMARIEEILQNKPAAPVNFR